ncbi:hypothetical protein NP493_843g01017 [Ridgeia piscesae]|uniref:Uncharacterized protein n=1 Tax=Ridgeia piscesae TaxID=27915 RepID=A0AAD9KM44_RIDPI|nr:hypothetical protein NP493_843g01017 [Ridgeia piscesae]
MSSPKVDHKERDQDQEGEEGDYGEGIGNASYDLEDREPNKFDGLCDGVLNTLAMMHSSVQELLALKDQLLNHALPPNTLLKIALVSTHVFRSISDMTMPVNELIRLVRVYSQPWEEKSASLKKLHDDYEAKKQQLAVAIKRLQLVDAHSKRIAKEKRIMNWEKLFAKLTVARGHGRRWKFLIHAFKKKADEGIEQLHEYIDSMERMHDSELGDDEVTEVDTQMQHEPSPSLDAPTDEDKDEDEESRVADSEMESGSKGDLVGDESTAKSEEVVSSEPDTKDADVWTHEPQYERFLHVRVFKPEGLDQKQICCKLSYGKQRHTTPILDFYPAEGVVEKVEEEPVPINLGENKLRKGKGRGLIGQRAGMPPSPPVEQEEPVKKYIKFTECVFEVPEEPAEGIWDPHRKKNLTDDQLRISVNHGNKEALVAMATIDMTDLTILDLPSLRLLPSGGDDCEAVDEPIVTLERPDGENSPAETGFKTLDQILEIDPMEFPLYAVDTGMFSDTGPIGQLPMVIFWGKRPIPRAYHRTTESTSVRDIVLDMTGFDLHLITKEELHKEMVERYVSPMTITPAPSTVTPEPEPTPEPKEETVLKTEYDRMVAEHQDKIKELEFAYESRLEELAETLEEMQSAPSELPRPLMTRSTLTSPSLAMRMTPEKMFMQSPHMQTPPIIFETQPPPQPPPMKKPVVKRPKPAVKSEQPILREMPQDIMTQQFLQKLKKYEEEALQRKQELAEKTYKEVSEMIEKKLAGEFKLCSGLEDDMCDVVKDVSLPAVFMPTRGTNVNIYNPRAHDYFHAMGAGTMRLTQPPSMIELPPLPKNKLPVLNLFDLSRNFHKGGTDWLLERYLASQTPQFGTESLPKTPGPTQNPRGRGGGPEEEMFQTREPSEFGPVSQRREAVME